MSSFYLTINDGRHQRMLVIPTNKDDPDGVGEFIREFLEGGDRFPCDATILLPNVTYVLSMFRDYVAIAGLFSSWNSSSVYGAMIPSAEWDEHIKNHLHYSPAVRIARSVLSEIYGTNINEN